MGTSDKIRFYTFKKLESLIEEKKGMIGSSEAENLNNIYGIAF